jgi:hypothetical protein
MGLTPKSPYRATQPPSHHGTHRSETSLQSLTPTPTLTLTLTQIRPQSLSSAQKEHHEGHHGMTTRILMDALPCFQIKPPTTSDYHVNALHFLGNETSKRVDKTTHSQHELQSIPSLVRTAASTQGPQNASATNG